MANFNDPFFNHDMDDVFNQMLQGMGKGESARYVVNGHEMTPDEFAQSRAVPVRSKQGDEIPVETTGEQAVKKGGILEKLLVL